MGKFCIFTNSWCADWLRKLDTKAGIGVVTTIEQKAVGLLSAFERAGKIVSRVTIDGRKIEIELSNNPKQRDEFDGIEMRHGKT